MTKEEIVEKLKILNKKYINDGIEIYGLFGSYARGEDRESSDIDIVYKLDKEKFFSLYKGFKSASKISRISQEISLYLGKKIDFISYDTTNQALKESINKELIR